MEWFDYKEGQHTIGVLKNEGANISQAIYISDYIQSIVHTDRVGVCVCMCVFQAANKVWMFCWFHAWNISLNGKVAFQRITTVSLFAYTNAQKICLLLV